MSLFFHQPKVAHVSVLSPAQGGSCFCSFTSPRWLMSFCLYQPKVAHVCVLSLAPGGSCFLESYQIHNV